MTELLSKEKEFLKLNEQLDRLASTNAGEQQQSPSLNYGRNSPRSYSNGSTRIDSKFLTYQKTKGQSTLLKKRGAGDGISEIVDTTNAMATKKGQPAKGTEVETYCQTRHGYGPTTTHGHSTVTTTMPQYRTKQMRNTEPTRSLNHNRVSNSRVPPTNTSTFTVKYRNPKYVESPSLEVLVRDECSRNESVASIASDDICSTGRRSQTSNNSMAPKKNISADGLIKFLKSKITILEDDHARISQEMTQQKELLDKALECSKLVEQQREQASAKNISVTDQLSKVEAQLDDANRRLKEKSLEQASQLKEFETVKRELKILSQTNTNLEKRLFRANEDLENTRSTLAAMKNSERELKEAARIDAELKDKQIKSLKKQRADLLNAYKKQLFLIDNLKRQNICMEQSKMIAFGEKEFSKVLEWNMNKS